MPLLDTDTVHTRHTTGQIPCYHGRRQPTCCSTRQLGAADSSVTADPLGLGLSLTAEHPVTLLSALPRDSGRLARCGIAATHPARTNNNGRSGRPSWFMIRGPSGIRAGCGRKCRNE
jgi:hypothetical protein